MRALSGWIAAAAVLVALAFGLDGYAADLFRKLLLIATLSVGFNFLFGIAGQIAFSHIAFYGIGAYGVVILGYQVGLPMPLAIIGSVLVCAVIAILVAIPATRLEGFFLALATLAFAQLFSVVLLQGGEVTGGPQGLSGYQRPGFAGTPIGDGAYSVIIAGVFLATLAILLRLDRSWFGRACRAIRDNPVAASAMGVDVFRVKVAAFALTSTLAGAAGISYAFVDNYLSPLVFGLEPMFLLLFMIIIGGTGNHAGAIVGATLLFLAPEVLEEWIGRRYLLGFGILVVVAILFQPTGLVGIWDSLWKRRRGGAFR
jgi:branched-chain amino acid transport system permease protein